MIKPRRMRAHMGEMRNSYRVLLGKTDGRYDYKYLDVGGRLVLKFILEK
jgi:hypothetical protein